MNATATKPEIFTTWSDEIENRLDCYYYKSDFRHKLKQIISAKYPTYELGDLITDLKNGVEIRTYSDSGFRYLRVTDLGEDGLNDSDPRYVTVDAIPEKIKLSLSDFLISRSGSLGLVSEVTEKMLDCILSSHIFRVTLDTSKILPAYLSAYLRLPYGQFQFFQKNNGGVVPEINQDALKSIKIIVPPPAVQKKVVELIQTAYEQKRKKEEEIKKILASIDDFVLGELGIKLPEGGAEQVYEIWSDEIERRIDPTFYRPYYRKLLHAIEAKNNARLGELVELSNETWDQKNVFTDTFPYIEISVIDLKTGDIADIGQVPITDAPSRAKMVVRQGDIIVSTTRPSRGAIAKIEKEQDGAIASTGFAVLRKMKTDKISKDFLFVMLRSILSLKQMEQRATGGNYPAITSEDLQQIRIVLPDKMKQEKITSGVQSSYSKMRTLRAQAAKILAEAQKQVEQMILA